MTPGVFARVAPAVTVFFEDSGPFGSCHATSLARAVMEGDPLARPERPGNDIAINNMEPDTSIAAGDADQRHWIRDVE